MMRRCAVIVFLLLLGFTGPQRVLAQNAPAAPAAPAPPAGQNLPGLPAAPAPAPVTPRATVGTAPGAAPRNIRFDIAINDTGVTTPITKVVTVNVSAGGNGSIRSSAKIPGARPLAPRTVTSQGPDGKP